jgi:AdoMet-dependent rRNA methyltransferase SPB1
LNPHQVVAQNFGPPGGIYGLPGGDTREYDSDNEDYDAEDYARTLALGQQMLRTSGKRALIDASYNRYSWNDPQGLPDWFVDDEKDHYRPQLPIARDVMEQMKDKFIELSSKPIKKVAEARARKRKRAVKKLTDAKKKASNIADNQDISGFEKMNAIKKAMRGSQITNPGKVYVVGTKKGATGTKGRTGNLPSCDLNVWMDIPMSPLCLYASVSHLPRSPSFLTYPNILRPCHLNFSCSEWGTDQAGG